MTEMPNLQPSPDWNMVELRWAGVTLAGRPAEGRLQLTYNGVNPMLDESPLLPIAIFPVNLSVPLETIETVIDGESRLVGYASIMVPASNDPDIIGGGGSYTFSELLTNAAGRSGINFIADKDTSVIWLNRLDGGTPSTPAQPLPGVQFGDIAGKVDLADLLDPTSDVGVALASRFAVAPAEGGLAAAAVSGVVARNPAGTPTWTTTSAIIARALGWAIATDPVFTGANTVAKLRAARDSGAKTVYVPDGDYTLTSALTLNVADQQWVFSTGAKFVLANSANSDTIEVTAPRVTLTLPRWDGNADNQTGGGGSLLVTADDCTLNQLQGTNTAGVGINCTGGRLRINGGLLTETRNRSCWVHTPNATTSIEGPIIEGLVVRNTRTGPYGIAVQGLGTASRVVGGQITTCRVTLPVGATSGLCIEAHDYATGMCISTCRTVGGRMGISLSLSHGSTVTCNTVFGPHEIGIEVAGCLGATVTGNPVDGNGVTNRLIAIINTGGSIISVSGNTLRNWKAGGNAVYATTSDYVIISENPVDGPSQPFVLELCNHFKVIDNTAKGNGTCNDGVNLGNCGPGVVRGNTWVNFVRSAVFAYNGTMTGYKIGPDHLEGTTPNVPLMLGGGVTAVGAGSIVRGSRGPSSQRIAPAVAGKGADWYDETLDKPVYSNGTAWRDATGAVA